MSIATQADIDKLTEDAVNRGKRLEAVEAEVKKLKDANPGLDISGLQAALAGDDTTLTQIETDLNPAPTNPGTGTTDPGTGTTDTGATA